MIGCSKLLLNSLVVLWILFAGAGQGLADVKLRVVDASALPHTDVSVGLHLSASEDVGGMMVELAYDDSALEFKSVERGTLLNGKNVLLESNAEEAGRIRIAFVGLDSIGGDGALLQLVFKVKGTFGSSSELQLQTVEAMESETMRELRTESINGRVSVSGFDFPWWVWALLALMVLAVIVKLMSRGRNTTQPAPTPAPTAPAAGGQRFCGQCGAAIQAGNKFCGSCGAKVDGK